MASLLALTEDGRTIEISVVGNEGFTGVPIIHKVYTSPYRVMVQTPVAAVKIETEVVSAELDRASALRGLLSGYAHVHETQLVQAVVCNLYHSVEQRIAHGAWW
jgi:hypothetical protein